jgi:hypothetical protein
MISDILNKIKAFIDTVSIICFFIVTVFYITFDYLVDINDE